MSKTKKRILSIIIILLVIGLIFLFIYLKSVNDYKKGVEEIQISNTDISTLPDGTYTGECDVNFIYAKVEVTIQNGRIDNIKLLEHKNDRGEAAEVIPDRIVEKQEIKVDAVSSATNSSKVIMKAVDNALQKK